MARKGELNIGDVVVWNQYAKSLDLCNEYNSHGPFIIYGFSSTGDYLILTMDGIDLCRDGVGFCPGIDKDDFLTEVYKSKHGEVR